MLLLFVAAFGSSAPTNPNNTPPPVSLAPLAAAQTINSAVAAPVVTTNYAS